MITIQIGELLTSGFKAITYAPWQPREGMKRTYADLAQAWGGPDSGRWPAAVREVVCERGAQRPIVYDRHARPLA